MINLIGRAPSQAEVLAVEGLHLHLYDKAPRPGRKIGHMNLCVSEVPILDQALDRIRLAIEAPGLDRFLARVESYA
jgi:5-(carboxyamino)imidazole ribonucleotide synthase